MNANQIENLIIRILSGKQILVSDEEIYELRSPSSDINLESTIRYQQAYEDHLYDDSFLRQEDIDFFLYDLGILYPQFDKDLNSLETRIENVKVDLYNNFFDNTKKNKFKKDIASLNRRYNEMLSHKHMFDFLTLENYCNNVKHAFVVSKTLYKYRTKTLVFDNDRIESGLFDHIISLISRNLIEMPQMKELARSDYWRSYYSINKTQLFPYSSSELSAEQKAILSVSLMYERVYEHPDCPNADIINDDDALDGWMITQSRLNKQQKTEKGVNSMLSGKMSKAKEIFLVAHNEQQRQDILGLNSTEGIQTIKQKRETVLSAEGSVQEAQLPDVQQDLRAQLQKLNTKR